MNGGISAFSAVPGLLPRREADSSDVNGQGVAVEEWMNLHRDFQGFPAVGEEFRPIFGIGPIRLRAA